MVTWRPKGKGKLLETEAPRSARPTVPPPFDPEEFARESESKMRMAKPAPEPNVMDSQVRLATSASTEQKYWRALGDPERVPLIKMRPNELRSLPLDPMAGFILSQIDGVSTVEMILDVSGMPKEKTLSILCDLVKRGVIDVR
jgi:hypothetical protein